MDRMLACATCHQPFIFYKREQKYFAARDWYPPRHCPACREKRKAEKQTQVRPSSGVVRCDP